MSQATFSVFENNIVRSPEGTRIPIDPTSKEYGTTLTEISFARNIPVDFNVLKPKCRYFCDIDSLVDYVRDEGLLLWTEPKQPGGDRHWIPKTSSKFTLFDTRFYQLHKVGTVREETDSGFEYQTKRTPVDIWAAEHCFADLEEHLQLDNSAVRCVSALPTRRCFVYFDISDFSKYRPIEQALVITYLSSLIGKESHWLSSGSIAFQSFEKRWPPLCIGDGYIICYEHATPAVVFAVSLARKIELAIADFSIPIDFHFRVSIHFGKVLRFWDVGKKGWNFVGSGINGGNRVLSAIGKETDDLIFVSWEVRNALMKERNESSLAQRFIEATQPRGRRSDKHGNMWRVFEINHSQIDTSHFFGYLQ